MIKFIIKATAVICSVLILFCFPYMTALRVYPTDVDEEIKRICSVTAELYEKNDSSTRIMTYNILSDGAGFGGTDCNSRASSVVDILNIISPDIICLQEMSRNWFPFIKKGTAYKLISPAETEIGGFMTAMLYNEDEIKLNAYGNEAYSFGADYRTRRAVWGYFEDTNGKDFCVINTHFDITREGNNCAFNQGMELVALANELADKYKAPIFIAGDFNAKKRTSVSYTSSSVYEILASHFQNTKSHSKITVSADENCQKIIGVDHIFFVGEAAIEQYIVLRQESFLALSDHYPIFIDARIE